jgi:hypothetical protein
MTWLEALKEYRKVSGKFVVPMKGSPEYDAVRKIQLKLAGKHTEPKPVEKQPEPVVKEKAKKMTKNEELAYLREETRKLKEAAAAEHKRSTEEEEAKKPRRKRVEAPPPPPVPQERTYDPDMPKKPKKSKLKINKKMSIVETPTEVKFI